MSVKAWENGPSYIDLPSGMTTFAAPLIPDPEAVSNLGGAREAMSWLQQSLSEWRPDSQQLIANLNGLDAENRELVNQILGEGEVSMTCTGNITARVQESVMAGAWRILYFDGDDQLSLDLLEVAPVPHVISLVSDHGESVDSKANGDAAIAANALPILVELAAAQERYLADGTEHSVNLTLLPISGEEHDFIEHRLGQGPVSILSRAYGKCEVKSTRSANIWWIRYSNSMDKLILDLVEVTDVPAVVAAAPEDIADSAIRLGEILAPYWRDEA